MAINYPYIEEPIIIIIWVFLVLLCMIEAYFCTDWDPETKRYLKNKEKNGNKRIN